MSCLTPPSHPLLCHQDLSLKGVAHLVTPCLTCEAPPPPADRRSPEGFPKGPRPALTQQSQAASLPPWPLPAAQAAPGATSGLGTSALPPRHPWP